MPYAIITRDKPNSLQVRNQARAEHLEYLTRNQDKLLAAGAQTDDDGQGGYGGIIIVEPRTAPKPRRSSGTTRSPKPAYSPESRWCAGARRSSTKNV